MTILGHIQACPTRFLTQKTFVILKKRWPNKKLLLGRRACSDRFLFCFVLLFKRACGVSDPQNVFSSLKGCLISFFFAEVGDTCCFHFPMLLSHLSLLAAYGCSLILGSRTIVLRVTRSRIVTLLQIQFVRCGI